jgi:hypothetical protein
MMLHDRAQIIAIHHARNKPLAQFDFGHGIELRARPQPLQEMIRLIAKSGHISRRDIQEMLRPPHAVGNAAARGAAAVDDGHPERLLAQPRQVHGGHDAAEAASDDGDAFRLWARHDLME